MRPPLVACEAMARGVVRGRRAFRLPRRMVRDRMMMGGPSLGRSAQWRMRRRGLVVRPARLWWSSTQQLLRQGLVVRLARLWQMRRRGLVVRPAWLWRRAS